MACGRHGPSSSGDRIVSLDSDPNLATTIADVPVAMLNNLGLVLLDKVESQTDVSLIQANIVLTRLSYKILQVAFSKDNQERNKAAATGVADAMRVLDPDNGESDARQLLLRNMERARAEWERVRLLARSKSE